MISIRKAILDDAELIQFWENDLELWKITDEPGPFLLKDIQNFLSNQNDLFKAQQERWLIVNHDLSIGMLDVFEWDLNMKSIGVGIVIMKKEWRGKGIGREVMRLLELMLSSDYGVNCFWALVWVDNHAAICFFSQIGYHIQKELMHQGKKAFRFEKKIQ